MWGAAVCEGCGLPALTNGNEAALCPEPSARCPKPFSRILVPFSRCPKPIAGIPVPFSRCLEPFARCPRSPRGSFPDLHKMASAGPRAAQDGGGRPGEEPGALGQPRPHSATATAPGPALRQGSPGSRPRTARGGSSRHGEPGTRDGAGWDGVGGGGKGHGAK